MNNEPFLSDDDIALLKRTILKGFAEDQQDIFIRTCQRTRLDPLTRQIYATRRMSHGNVTLVTVTGIQGLQALAERTGQYNGCQVFWAGTDGVWREEWLSEEYPAAAKAIVHHKGHDYPEIGIARWEGYCGRSFNSQTKRWDVSDFWSKFPDMMLSKVARALALRGAFPDHLSGLYAAEELDQSRMDGDEMDDERKVAANRKREEELLKKASAQGIKIVESKPAPRPSPAEAAAPAPEPPAPVPASTQVDSTRTQEGLKQEGLKHQMPDDLDMEPSQPPQPEPSADAPPAGSPAAWREHVIEGIKSDKYVGRKVGDLSPVELAATANWIGRVRSRWDENLSKAQRDDCLALEQAIANSGLERPW